MSATRTERGLARWQCFRARVGMNRIAMLAFCTQRTDRARRIPKGHAAGAALPKLSHMPPMPLFGQASALTGREKWSCHAACDKRLVPQPHPWRTLEVRPHFQHGQSRWVLNGAASQPFRRGPCAYFCWHTPRALAFAETGGSARCIALSLAEPCMGKGAVPTG